ncbi:alpha/beta hydrolase [Hansschlegelia plantiphila]|uniref:Esterase n=1 Tax=Hansschlegelia plantiphila TaxID=374655 RepID=A0A9W6J0M2_9HYPH|nr:alpha/beta hydrolase-fold protein [Hansschlegelia plantiphila]GLK68167.1 esterase [Hansschlegelia plantiphila]
MPSARLCAALLVAAFLAAAPASAQVGVVERGQTAYSEALNRRMTFNVYRPLMEPRDGERWPVIYLLEGRPADDGWLDMGSVYEVVDRAVEEGVIPPSLIVMPQAPFSWYVDNPDPGGAGMVRTALTRDLIAAVDARYPTAACRTGRVVGGLSMGGYGALLFGMDRADEFVAAASFSGAIAPPIEANDPERLKRANPFYDGAFGRPISRERFNAWNLFTRLPTLKTGGGPKPDFYLAVGDRDRGGLLQATTRLHIELLRAGADSTLRVGPGGHDWETWRAQFADALRWLGPKLDPTCEQQVAERPRRRGGEQSLIMP